MKFYWAKISREWLTGRDTLEYEGRFLLEKCGQERYLLGVLINGTPGTSYRKSHILGIGKQLIQIRLNSAGNIYENCKPAVYMLEDIKEETSMRVSVGEIISANYQWKHASAISLVNGCTIDAPPFEGAAHFVLAEKVYKPKRMQPEKNKLFKALQTNPQLFSTVLGENNYQKFIELVTSD